MTLTQVWGSLVIFVVCPLLGGVPLIEWITYGLTGCKLSRVGTGNVSVSAAFYHGGRLAGILAVLSEALKGIAAVLLARYFFPTNPVWEILALISLVLGRYWMAQGAGTTNVVWGYIVHDPIAAGLILLLSGVGFTLLRERQAGKLSVLILLPMIAALRHPYEGDRIVATVVLSLLMVWIYQNIPDDLELPAPSTQGSSRKMFRFFQGNRAVLTLDQTLLVERVGQKAATLSQLRRWGYPVPIGWVLPPGDDPAPLLETVQPSQEQPVIVRSSAIGEDSDTASAAGQYVSIPNITDSTALAAAITRCQLSYSAQPAMQYRQDRKVLEGGMGVLIQRQIQGVFSGVAFSRDPIARQGNTVVIEALPGGASQIVFGQVTPEQYYVRINSIPQQTVTPALGKDGSWLLPDDINLPMQGTGEVPPRLIQQVAYLARHLEERYHGIPQDIEWTYDGQQLWVLQSRPITTLLPIWTRKIAAEVIPGCIRPLTWSINRPLTCGVWGEIFTIVLGDRAQGLDFNQTATLHHGAAYFNASLLGDIFLRMGLPAESLEFLTRGAKFSKPPLFSTVRNLPGLWRLAQREFSLIQDFERDDRTQFQPGLTQISRQSAGELSPIELLERIETILHLLKRATYYSILAPLSLALRQAILKVNTTDLDNSQLPEVASLRALQQLVNRVRPSLSPVLTVQQIEQADAPAIALLNQLGETAAGQAVLQELEAFLSEYGYLSEVATDIAVPTWREDPRPIYELFAQLLLHPSPAPPTDKPTQPSRLQNRLDLKGRVTTVYNRLLAELRWSFVALASFWQAEGFLMRPEDIFFLEFSEIRSLIVESDTPVRVNLPQLIEGRRSQFEHDCQLDPVPLLVYGNDPPAFRNDGGLTISSQPSTQKLQGIGASPGRVEGRVLVLRSLQAMPPIESNTILVVPYTDSGWAPLLARARGVIAEVGGRLSHGAILAREYGIPAVMDIHDATQQLRDGQRVRIDGQLGIVEILD
jgi:pyruvate,water dikinase